MTLLRNKFIITGQVQGVGFRPFVYRIATEHSMTGFVNNSSKGVVIEAQGNVTQLADFTDDLKNKIPPLAHVVTFDMKVIQPLSNESDFTIVKSEAGNGHSVLISPDVATCADCLDDLSTPHNRRFRYPFTNCTNCGPRYTITRSIPYDRPQTSMACFQLCSECQTEYEAPVDRRFHAQPNACPHCGPKVWLTDNTGITKAQGDSAIRDLAVELGHNKIAAIKGLGGFHLTCDANSDEAVTTLRERKQRPDKPLAVMVPDIETARRIAIIHPEDVDLLTGRQRPIVLCEKQPQLVLSDGIAPDTNFIGIMLAYTPLHHILMADFAAQNSDRIPALVMTSGNMSSEPICLGNRESLQKLQKIADIFLFHNRDILIRTDDSVVRSIDATHSLFVRRARGYVPSPVFLSQSSPSVLGTGPELKCTLTLTKEDKAFQSQHIGTLSNLDTLTFYNEIHTHFENILQIRPELIVCDLHPDYMTSEWAQSLAAERNIPIVPLQHHYAHIHAVLAEHTMTGPALGLALDGTGYGEDGTLWGGECLFVSPETLEQQRLAHFTHIPLPGGEAAVRQPWRIAQAALREIGITEPGTYVWPWLDDFAYESKTLPQLLDKNINSPLTSSCGRLFDAVAALCGLANTITYEGQAAIRLEKAQDMSVTEAYPCSIISQDPVVLNTLALIQHVINDLDSGVAVPIIARRFHLGLIQGLAEMAYSFSMVLGVHTVALSGGVMQNLTMAKELPQALHGLGLVPLMHTYIPPNDACISLGQAAWGQFKLKQDSL